MSINLLHIVGAKDPFADMTEKGNTLEMAVASSIWARYRLNAEIAEFIQLSKLVPWHDDAHFVRN